MILGKGEDEEEIRDEVGEVGWSWIEKSFIYDISGFGFYFIYKGWDLD